MIHAKPWLRGLNFPYAWIRHPIISQVFKDSRHIRCSFVTHTSKFIDMAASMKSDDFRQELIQLHKSAFGWAMLCCGRDRDLAAEVLQEAYCRILMGAASFAEKSNFSTWVFGVIRHVAHEELRQQQRRRRLVQPNAQIASQACSAVDSKHVPIEQLELADQLGWALEQLSDRQREVLHLTFYENMTIEQAANTLDITVGSSRQHYQRGKASLRRILAKNWECKR